MCVCVCVCVCMSERVHEEGLQGNRQEDGVERQMDRKERKRQMERERRGHREREILHNSTELVRIAHCSTIYVAPKPSLPFLIIALVPCLFFLF